MSKKIRCRFVPADIDGKVVEYLVTPELIEEVAQQVELHELLTVKLKKPVYEMDPG